MLPLCFLVRSSHNEDERQIKTNYLLFFFFFSITIYLVIKILYGLRIFLGLNMFFYYLFFCFVLPHYQITILVCKIVASSVCGHLINAVDIHPRAHMPSHHWLVTSLAVASS
jgi:hypothetical protein